MTEDAIFDHCKYRLQPMIIIPFQFAASVPVQRACATLWYQGTLLPSYFNGSNQSLEAGATSVRIYLVIPSVFSVTSSPILSSPFSLWSQMEKLEEASMCR